LYSSFLVRVWFEGEEQWDTGWQAEVQQIQSGESWVFNSREELLAFFNGLPRLLDESDSETNLLE